MSGVKDDIDRIWAPRLCRHVDLEVTIHTGIRIVFMYRLSSGSGNYSNNRAACHVGLAILMEKLEKMMRRSVNRMQKHRSSGELVGVRT